MFTLGASANQANRPALPVETEHKLILPAAQAKRLWKVPPLSTLLANRPTRHRFFSAYYDTPDLVLHKRGVALRLRRQGRHWVQRIEE